MFWDLTISKTLNICAYSLISVTLFSRTRRFSHFQKFHYFLFCFTKSFKRKLKSVRAIPLLLWIINLGIPLNQHCSTFTYFFISFLGKLMVFLTSCFLFFLLETKKEYIFLKNKKNLKGFLGPSFGSHYCNFCIGSYSRLQSFLLFLLYIIPT